MFTHAEFNRNGRQIGRAFVTRTDGAYAAGTATIWQFECGDVAYWVRGQFIAWPHEVRAWNLYLNGCYSLFDAGQMGELGTRINEQ